MYQWETSYEKSSINCKKFVSISMVKRVTLIIEIKFDFVCEPLPDNPDELADAVPKSIVVRPAFGSLGIIIRLESRIVLYNVMSCIHKGIPKYMGSSLGHTSSFGLKVSRLIYGWIQSGECKQFSWC